MPLRAEPSRLTISVQLSKSIRTGFAGLAMVLFPMVSDRNVAPNTLTAMLSSWYKVPVAHSPPTTAIDAGNPLFMFQFPCVLLSAGLHGVSVRHKTT